MAIGRITGPLLAKNLVRDGVDLAFDTNLLYLDVTNGRVGIRNSSPAFELDVNGTINSNNLRVLYNGPGTGVTQLGQLVISNGLITTSQGPITLQPSGNDVINLVGNTTVTGNFHATGNITADGNIVIGNNTSTDTVVVDAEIASDLVPKIDNGFSLGSTERNWLNAYISNLVTSQISNTGTINISPGINNLTQINSELRVTGKNPIGTAPVVTNVLYVTMDGNDTNDGRADDPSRACKTISGAVRSPYYRPGTLIKVRSGHYLENNPILLQPNTAIVGDDLRTTSIEAINKTQDLFHVQSGCYIAQMQFLNGRSGLLPGPYVNGTNRGAYCTAFAPQVGGNKIDVYQSPYIQNCTNQTGPWLVDGTLFVPNQTVQIPQAVGTANFTYNTTTLLVTLSTGTIVPGLNVISGPQDAGFFNARTLLLANLSFLQDQTVAWVNYQVVNGNRVFVPQLNAYTDFTNFSYSQAKCYRDVGLIVQNVAYDTTFGGNEKSIEAGSAYWNGVINLIEGQQGQTIAALNYLNSLSQTIIKNSSTVAAGLVYSSATSQTINTALINGFLASDEVATAYDTIITIIDKGPSVAPSIFKSCGPETPLVSAELLLQANRNFLQNEVVAYVNATYPTFVYKQDFCFRDTGLIVDAVSQDIIVGGNTKSIECGLSYFTGAKGDSSIAVTAIQNNFTLLKDIIRNGPNSQNTVTDVGPNLGTSFSNAQNILLQNLLFVQTETSAYVRSLFNDTFRLTQEQQNLCYRDIGTILTAIANDTAAGGNVNTVASGVAYYNNGVIILPNNQPEYTLLTLDYMSYLATNIVQNNKLNNLYNNKIEQVLIPNSGNANQIVVLNSLIDRITTIINDGPTTLINGQPITPAPITLTPNGRAGNRVSADLVNANKYFIQSEIVSYVDSIFNPTSGYYTNYSRSKCLRDTGLIVDAICNDLLFGGTSQSDFAGLQYWSQNGYTGLISSEINTTTASISYVNNLTQEIIQNITNGGTTRYSAAYHPNGSIAQTQKTSLSPATSDEAKLVNDEFTLITNILSSGDTAGVTDLIIPNGFSAAVGNVLDAVKLIQANKIYIQEQAVAFVEATKPVGYSYSQAKCYRDIGYILDSISFDLLYGGNKQAIQSAVYYYAFAPVINSLVNNERPQITLAYEYIKDLSVYVIQGLSVPTTYQNSVSQQTVGSIPGTQFEINTVGSNIDRITTIINQGPEAVINGQTVTPSPIESTPNVIQSVINAATQLENNKDFIAAEVIAYINFNGAISYDSQKCARDVGFIVDALAQDLLFGGTSQSDFAGLQYWSQTGYYNLNIFKETPAIINTLNHVSSYINTNYSNNGAATYFTTIVNILNKTTPLSTISDSIVPNTLTRATSGSKYNTAQVLITNRTAIIAEGLSYALTQYKLDAANQVKCSRDLGYILDSIIFDLLYGGNKQTVQSGVYYFSYSAPGNSIPEKEISQTTAAYNYIKTMLSYIVRGKSVPKTYQTAVSQVFPGSVGTSNDVEVINQNIDLITDIITKGPGAAPAPQPISMQLTFDGDSINSFNLLQKNKDYIAAELTGWITDTFTPLFNYNQSNCYRDTGLIIDSIAFDILQNDNSQIIFSGLQYYNQAGYTGAIDKELTTTTAAINYAKNLAQKIVTNTTVTNLQSKVSQFFDYSHTGSISSSLIIGDLFSTVTGILSNGTVGITNQIVPNGLVSTDISTVNAYNLLQKNKSFIEEEVIAYVDSNLSQYSYNETKCLRDTGLIVDAIALDLAFGGTSQSDFAGLQYWNQNGYTGQINVELNQTVDAINFVSVLSQQIVQNISTGTRYVTPATQIRNVNTATLAEANIIANNFNTIVNILSNGTTGVTDVIVPNNYFASTGTIALAYNNLQSNKTYIQQQAVAHVEATKPSWFVYSSSTCYRDVGYIIDSISFDLLYGGNKQSVQSGVYYYSFSTTQNAIPASEKSQVTAAYNHIKNLIGSVVQGQKVSSTYQNVVKQVGIGISTGTSAQVIALDASIDRITNIINNGPATTINGSVITPTPITLVKNTSTVAALTQLSLNKSFIQAETVAYIDNYISSLASFNYNYSQPKCSRDVGLIVDALTQDLLFGGTSQTDFSALQYWNQNGYTGNIPSELTTTTSAIVYAGNLAKEIVQGITSGGVKRYTTAHSQVTGTVASTAEATTIQNEIDVIVNIINNGTVGVSDLIVPNSLTAATGNKLNAYNLIQSNLLYIEDQVIAWITDTYPSYTAYNQTSCKRDIGYIMSSISFDLLYGGNRQAVQSGVYYYSFSNTSSAIPNAEKPQVTAAYNYIKTLVNYIVQSQAVPKTYQNLVTQTLSTSAGGSSEVLAINANVDRITTVINNGPTAISITPTPITNTPSAVTSTINAASLLNSNRDFIRAEVVAYINNYINSEPPYSFYYDQAKCQRDVRLIVDSLAQDLLFNGSSQSNFSGLQYWAQGTSAIPGEESTTTAAISYIKDLAIKIISNDTSGTRYQTAVSQYLNLNLSVSNNEKQVIYDEFNIVNNLITNGTAGVTDIIVPNGLTASNNAFIQAAYTLLEANKSYLQAEAVAFVETTKSFGYTYNQNKCYRDIGYILDSVAFDLLHGGNRQAVQSGVCYYGFDGATSVPNEIPQVTAAYNFIKNLITYIIVGQRVPSQYQDSIIQVTSNNIGSLTEVASAAANIDLITNIINNGASVAQPLVPISITPSTTASTINAANLLSANKEFITAETVAFINKTFVNGFNYNRDTCRRDVGYIIDSVSFDLLHGGNRQSVQSGVYYYNYNSTSSVITYELAQVTSAYNRIKEIASKVITNTPVTPSPNNVATQIFITSSNAGSNQVSVIENEIDIVNDIINNGPSGYYAKKPINLTQSTAQGDIDAFNLLIANRTFIQEEIIAYINYWFSRYNYNKDKCLRDIGFIVDAIAQDLAFSGGSSQSDFAGLQYWSQNGYYNAAITAESSAIIATLNYLINYINTTYSNNGAASYLTTINNILDGTIPLATISDYIVPNTLVPTYGSNYTTYLVLQNNRSAIIAAGLAYAYTQYPSLNGTKCSRDLGYILDSISFDLLYGGNKQTVQSGVYYFSYAAPQAIALAEKPQVIAAYDHIKTLVNYVIQGQAYPNPLQNIYSQTGIGSAGGTVNEINEVNSNIDRITIIIDKGPNTLIGGLPIVPSPIGLVENTASAVENAAIQLENNRNFIANEVLYYIISQTPVATSFNYDKCVRDTKLIVDALAQDLLFGGTSQSDFAGVQYWSQTGYYNTAILNEVSAIEQTLNYIASYINTTYNNNGAATYLSTIVGILNKSIPLATITDYIVPNTLPKLTSGAAYNTAQILQLHRSDIISAGLNYGTSIFPLDPVNKAKCQRDLGYILDSITFDLLYGGNNPTPSNKQTVQSGVYYYAYGKPNSSVAENEKPQVTAAYDYIKTLSKYVVQNLPVPTKYQSVASQVYANYTATTNEIAIISNDIDRITTIINNGPGALVNGNPITPSPISLTASSTSTWINAAKLLELNRNFIQSEVVAYINQNFAIPFVFDEIKCSRDTKIIIDSVALDLIYGGNTQSAFAGIQYWSQNSLIIPNEQTTTTNAIVFVRDYLTNTVLATYPDAASVVTNNINQIISIINDGTSGITDLIIPNGLPSTNSDTVAAFNAIQSSKSVIETITLDWINTTYPTFNYNRTSCSRDVGYILDCVSFDLLNGGNRQSIQAGAYYYSYSVPSAVIANERPQVTAAYDYIKTLSNYIVRGVNVPTTYQNSVSQTLSANTGTINEINAISHSIDRITTIINNGPAAVVDGQQITPRPISLNPSVTTSTVNASKILESNRSFIAAEVVAYINQLPSYYPYNNTKCLRDTGFVVDALAQDLLFGGTSQSDFAGLQYFNQNGYYNNNISNELSAIEQTLSYVASYINTTFSNNGAVNYFNTIIGILNGSIPLATISDYIAPNTLTRATSGANYNTALIIITNRRTIVSAGLQFALTKVSLNVANQNKCARDLGYILDSITFDLLYGGNKQTVQSGVYYYSFGGPTYVTNNIENEVPQVVAAFNQLKYIISSIIQNIPLSRSYQKVHDQIIIPSFGGVTSVIYGEENITADAITYLNSISQKVIANQPVPVIRSTATQVFVPTLEGGLYASNAVTRNYTIISDIIKNGPGAAPVPFVGSGLFATTGVSSDDVRQSPVIISIATVTNNTYQITLSGPTVGESQGGTLYFGNTLVYPATDQQVEEASFKYTGSSSTWNSRKVDVIGAMGGSLVDGSVISDRSPIQSFVYDAFTQVCQGGKGVHVTNNGYAQLVSVFSIFCSVGVQTDNGGIASIVNSNANFGDICLLSYGFGKKEFSGTVYNPSYPTYQINGQYYPLGYYPQRQQVEVYIPDKANRPHIALVMEVEPPDEIINYSGVYVPFRNDQGYPGFLNATPSVAFLNTGSLTIDSIDTNGIAVGNSVYITDQYGNTGTVINNVFAPYAYPGTFVTDVSYQQVTLNIALGNGGQDPKNNSQSINTDYFNVYFCGKAYYTVLSSTINDNFGKTLGTNLLPTTIINGVPYNQVEYEIDALIYLQQLLCVRLLPYYNVPQDAINYVTNLINNIMIPIISATDQITIVNGQPVTTPALQIAENYINPVKKGISPTGASVAINVITGNVTNIINAVLNYLTNTLGFAGFNTVTCTRDLKLILNQIVFDLESGGNYYSYYAGLSYWYRSGTHHVITMEENVTNTALFPDGATVNFYQRSYMSASGYVFEYVGAGVTYSALPQRGVKDPVQGKEVVQVNNGKVFYTSTDQNGDFRIGPELVISQATGVLSGRTFTKSLFANMTPFILAIEGGGL